MTESITYLNEPSIEQLQAKIDELTRIKKEKEKPVMDNLHDIRALQSMCQELIDDLEENGEYVDINDYEHYISSAALMAFYGKDVWTWINKQLS